MQLIKISLTRDEARAIEQYFFTYLEQVCTMKINQEKDQDDRLWQQLIEDQFLQVKKSFTRKLLTTQKKFTFTFTISQSIVMFQLLRAFPIHKDEVYLLQLRNLIMNIFYEALPK